MMTGALSAFVGGQSKINLMRRYRLSAYELARRHGHCRLLLLRLLDIAVTIITDATLFECPPAGFSTMPMLMKSACQHSRPRLSRFCHARACFTCRDNYALPAVK